MALNTNECIPFYEPGERITGSVITAQVTGKRFVKVAGSKANGLNVVIAPVTAGATKPFGVAGADCAVGDTVVCYTGGYTVPVTAGGTVTAGQEVEIDSVGRVVTLASGRPVGLALSDATIGVDCTVRIYT
jgi:hypothetical protein